jgi:hypothetical protein
MAEVVSSAATDSIRSLFMSTEISLYRELLGGIKVRVRSGRQSFRGISQKQIEVEAASSKSLSVYD